MGESAKWEKTVPKCDKPEDLRQHRKASVAFCEIICQIEGGNLINIQQEAFYEFLQFQGG
jgi:hypothetical protein